MKKLINEWVLIFTIFGILSLAIIFQMWYIYKIKSELKLFQSKEHVIITHVEILGSKYSTLTDTVKVKCNDTTSKKIIRKQYSERGVLNW
jgi:hypothetical protein